MKKYFYEFEWVMKVLDSCKTKSQVISSTNLFNSFFIKWSNSDLELEEYLISHSDQFNKKLQTSWENI